MNIEELRELKKRIECLENLMQHYGKDEIKLQCNTYGLHGDYISIAGKGFLPLYRGLTMDIEQGDYVIDPESENVDMRLSYEDIEYEYPETLCELGLKEEED